MKNYFELNKRANMQLYNRIVKILHDDERFQKESELIDVDGSLLTVFSTNECEFSIKNDNYYDSLFITSEDELPLELQNRIKSLVSRAQIVPSNLQEETIMKLLKKHGYLESKHLRSRRIVHALQNLESLSRTDVKQLAKLLEAIQGPN